MEKVEYSEETRYVWDCPKCGNCNEECEEPEEEVICYECYTEYKV
jgi:hypothetical protein